jgi:transcriptional regulator with XRE-family HTH domain
MSNKLTKNLTALERGKRLKFLRESIVAMRGEKFAELCGVTRGTITNWETGKGKEGLTEKGAKQIVKCMQDIGIACSVSWLLHGIGAAPRIVDPSKLSRLYYSMELSDNQQNVCEPSLAENNSYLEEVALFKEKHLDSLLYTFQDESMVPIYRIGDCVGGVQLPFEKFKLAQGRLCIVRLKSGEEFVRRVKLECAPDAVLSFYVVHAESALKYPPLSQVPVESILALAPIIRMWRNFSTLWKPASK